MSRVRIIACGIRRSHDERAVLNTAGGRNPSKVPRATHSWRRRNHSCFARFIRLSYERVCVCGGAITSFAAGCRPDRMRRTERDDCLPRHFYTYARSFQESIDPDLPHLAASNHRDFASVFSSSKTMLELPGARMRVRDFTWRNLLLVARKVVRMLQKERGAVRKKAKFVTDLAPFTITSVYYEAYFDKFSLNWRMFVNYNSNYFIYLSTFMCESNIVNNKIYLYKLTVCDNFLFFQLLITREILVLRHFN